MTREEALKEIKSWDFLEGKGIEAIHTLIPELAESEDERIRKELIGALMWQRDCLDAKGPHDNNLILPGFTMKVGDILRWLEKQKEQKPGPISCSHENGTPAEHKATINGEPISTKNQSVDIPLVGWSEEDEASYNAFICEVVNEKMNPTTEQVKWLRGVCDRLKSLHSQPKVEWSEEDEEMIGCIIDDIREAKRTSDKEYFKELCDKEIAWLKSLRPQSHWKPSEDQMNEMEFVINDYREDGCNRVADCLQEILEQMKKL